MILIGLFLQRQLYTMTLNFGKLYRNLIIRQTRTGYFNIWENLVTIIALLQNRLLSLFGSSNAYQPLPSEN